MYKPILSPLVRISFGLTMLTVSLLLVSDFIGLVPNNEKKELEHRKWAAESLAIQITTAIANQQEDSIQSSLDTIVKRNKSVQSVLVQKSKDKFSMVAGYHEHHWQNNLSNVSTANQVSVNIFDKNEQWGKLEISFLPIKGNVSSLFSKESFYGLIFFIACLGFFCYMFFLKKVVHELNTDDVIPERVSTALDTLTEGILIIDSSGYVVFSNGAFAELSGLKARDIVGLKMEEFSWGYKQENTDASLLPWEQVNSSTTTIKGEHLTLSNRNGKHYPLTVNATAIGQNLEKVQGVLVTFDDMSDIEAKNEQLNYALSKLQKTQDEVTEQNRQLHILATRDPLTDTLNRRSLYSGLESMMSEASWNKHSLSFLMVDIDHFKSVNDNYGHGVGDKVIIFLAQSLNKHTRALDLVARFGGEEFCVALPDTTIEEAAAIAEQMRITVESGQQDQYPEELKITASFGVSTLSNTAVDVSTLIDEADQALYHAKENGRNQVVCWPLSANTKIQPITTSQPTLLEEEVSILPALDKKVETKNTQAIPDSNPGQQDKPILHQPKRSDEERHFDDLLLFDRIDQAINRCTRYKTQFAVIALDIEMLQRINDTLGPAVGKKMLNAISARLKTALRDTDSILTRQNNEPVFSISSTGNREIVLLLTDLPDTHSLHAVTERILKSQSDPLEIEANEYIYSAKMGVSVYPQDGVDAQILLRSAHIAKSEAIQNTDKSSTVCFFSDEIGKQSKRKIRLEAELFRTIERDELVLFYQPKASLRNGKLLGFEALIRWQHPRRGLIPPNEFIPIAEATGLITELSQWVVRTACHQIRNWREQGMGEVNVSINLSPVEFRNSKLAKNIIGTVLEFGIPMHCLEIEITETIALDNMQVAIDTLEEISASGIQISVDDFGTGYASLSYLQKLPINKIKIDQSFIRGLLSNSNDSAIVSAVIAMGQTLGLEVVAEGVETLDELQFLQDMQCDQVQGYFLSRPVPCAEATALIQDFSVLQNLIVKNNNKIQHSNFRMSSALLSVINDSSDNNTPQSANSQLPRAS